MSLSPLVFDLPFFKENDSLPVKLGLGGLAGAGGAEGVGASLGGAGGTSSAIGAGASPKLVRSGEGGAG